MLEKINEFTESHGALRPGRGRLTGSIALALGILCFLGVLAFHFPEYLTTRQLRKNYDVEMLRKVMFGAMVVAGGVSLVNILFNRSRWLASFAFMFVVLTALLGGHKVPVNDFADNTPYIGLDWFILDLLGSALIFIFFAFLDHLFGTAVKSTREWPEAYGVLGDYVPNGFVRQFKFPFTWKG
ncbi:MAG: hypothetical protein ABIU58_04410 [Ramlibacter sp.]